MEFSSGVAWMPDTSTPKKGCRPGRYPHQRFRLAQEGIRAAVVGLALYFRRAERAEQNDVRVDALLVHVGHDLQSFHAADAREAKIGDDEIVMVIREQRLRFFQLVRRIDYVAEALEIAPHGADDEVFVVDDQNPLRFRPGLLPGHHDEISTVR